MTTNLYQSIAISGMLAALTAISIPSAAGNDAAATGWRKGFSSWNGSGYDLPEKVPTPWDSLPTGNSDVGSNQTDHRMTDSERRPYTVPTGPQTNPYYGPTDGQQMTNSDAAEVSRPKAADSYDEVSDLFTTLVSPQVTSDTDNQTVNTQPRAPRKLAAPSEATTRGETPTATALAAPANSSVPDDSKAADIENALPTAEHLSSTDVGNGEPAASAESTERKSLETVNDQSAGKLAEVATEPLPLEQEVIRWYQYPQRWMKGWDSHAEFGLDGSDGNADTLAIQTGLEFRRKSDLHSILIDIDYRQANAANTTTENNGRLNIDYDRMIAESPWSGFGKFGLEWDQFKPFDLRVNMNSGVGYHWIREDSASLVTRFGAGASREMGSPDDDWIPEAVFGFDAERQLNARNKIKARLDYFPSWADFGDFRLVTDAAWEILLDDSENLSLKLAVTDRYDSTPQGAEPNDVYYSLLLLYKF